LTEALATTWVAELTAVLAITLAEALIAMLATTLAAVWGRAAGAGAVMGVMRQR